MMKEIIQIFSKLLGGEISINICKQDNKTGANNNKVINNGNDNITAIGKDINIDLGPKIGVEKNDGSDDDYTLSIDTKK